MTTPTIGSVGWGGGGGVENNFKVLMAKYIKTFVFPHTNCLLCIAQTKSHILPIYEKNSLIRYVLILSESMEVEELEVHLWLLMTKQSSFICNLFNANKTLFILCVSHLIYFSHFNN